MFGKVRSVSHYGTSSGTATAGCLTPWPIRWSSAQASSKATRDPHTQHTAGCAWACARARMSASTGGRAHDQRKGSCRGNGPICWCLQWFWHKNKEHAATSSSVPGEGQRWDFQSAPPSGGADRSAVFINRHINIIIPECIWSKPNCFFIKYILYYRPFHFQTYVNSGF